ncbi:helix-turn-helix domain-containing protein [Acrocarpospora macrocephala]|uniref:helix-turn-helix domain-containing protein n=1 Tax=Acrocarpospora macrocephala TaxID=150177 RepID=UPI0012D30320|nr:helix-turn-helix domain-containing protein [Acrocarpospora macrocephala]
MAGRWRRAVFLLEQGKSPDDVARILNVSRRSLFAWQRDYCEHGEGGLRTKKTRGPDS